MLEPVAIDVSQGHVTCLILVGAREGQLFPVLVACSKEGLSLGFRLMFKEICKHFVGALYSIDISLSMRVKKLLSHIDVEI